MTIDADLAVTTGRDSFTLIGTGDTITVRFDGYRQAWRILRSLRRSRPEPGADALWSLLRRSALTLKVQVRDRTVSSIESGRRPLLARIAGF
ncbi:MAG: hypothetical protein Fues2KO_33680 [Fuerstiella sp.]